MRGETRRTTVRESRQATVTSYFDQRASVPMIRLRGRWLLRAGFRKGDPVQIKVEAGRPRAACRFFPPASSLREGY
jgi:hypothetical protein